MRVALVADHLAVAPWTAGEIARRLCAGLAERGLEVVVLAQSVEDVEVFAPFARVRAFRAFEHGGSDFPLGFESWVTAELAGCQADVSVSLSRRFAGNVWSPVSPSAASCVAECLDNAGMVRLAMSLGKHPETLVALARERVRTLVNMHNVHRLLAVGAAAAEQAGRRWPELVGRIVAVDAFSVLPELRTDEAAELRERTRRVLGLDAERLVVLISAMGLVGPWLEPVLSAVARLNTGVGGLGPAALVLSREQFPVLAAARRTGSLPHVRIMGPTAQIAAALAAADVVGLAEPRSGGVFASGATGRLAADALRFGRPLLAVRAASGSELAGYREPDGGRAGQILDIGMSLQAAGDAWRRVLAMAMHADWLVPASRAAHNRGRELGVEKFVGRVEEAIRAVVGEEVP